MKGSEKGNRGEKVGSRVDSTIHFTSRALSRSSKGLLSFEVSSAPPPASGEAGVSAAVAAGASRLSCCFHISSRSLS